MIGRLATGINDVNVLTLARYEFFAEKLREAQVSGKVMVIPAGDGFGVDWLVERGFDAYGVESNPQLVHHARSHFDPQRYSRRTLDNLLDAYSPGEFEALVSVQTPLPYTRQLLLYNKLRSFARKSSSLVKDGSAVLVSLQQHGACSISPESFVRSSVDVLSSFLTVDGLYAQLFDRVVPMDMQQAAEGKYHIPSGYEQFFSLMASCRR